MTKGKGWGWSADERNRGRRARDGSTMHMCDFSAMAGWDIPKGMPLSCSGWSYVAVFTYLLEISPGDKHARLTHPRPRLGRGQTPLTGVWCNRHHGAATVCEPAPAPRPSRHPRIPRSLRCRPGLHAPRWVGGPRGGAARLGMVRGLAQLSPAGSTLTWCPASSGWSARPVLSFGIFVKVGMRKGGRG